jgi:hypothetical protein
MLEGFARVQATLRGPAIEGESSIQTPADRAAAIILSIAKSSTGMAAIEKNTARQR